MLENAGVILICKGLEGKNLNIQKKTDTNAVVVDRFDDGCPGRFSGVSGC
jgi:hypothetical protein